MNLADWFSVDLEELRQCVHDVDASSAEGLARSIEVADRVFLVGLGRSGLVMRMFALRLMQLGLSAFVVGDATTCSIGPGDLLIVGSGSGETQGALIAARQAVRAGARVAAITARAESTLGPLSDQTLVVAGTTPKAAATGMASRLPSASVLEQAFLVVTDCIIAYLACRMGQTNEAMMLRHANLE